ncbi:MAG: pilus assembly protein PilM [Phycisphaerae bacterium]|nr:pilus assembly protein PilM [Phycisphaerae bacterium]
MSDKRDILILEASSAELRLSSARINGERVELSDSCSFVTQDRRDDRNAAQDQNLVDALSVAVSERNWVGRDVICLLSGGTVACQYFDMPSLKGAPLLQAVTLKLSQQLHFPVAEAVVDFRSVPSHAAAQHNQQRVAVTAAHQDAAQSVINAAIRCGLNVAAVTSAAAALTAHAVSRIAASTQAQAVLHIGDRSSTLTVLRESAVTVTSELPFGLEDFTTALMRPIISGEEVIQLDVVRAMDLRDAVGIPAADERIESLGIPGAKLFPVLEPTLQKMVQQLTQWLTFASTLEEGAAVSRLYVTGPGLAMKGLTSALALRLKLQIEGWDWLDGTTSTRDRAGGMSRDAFAAATAAVCHRKTLPDLVPKEVRSEWRARRIRRSTAIISPIVAVVILGFAFLFNQMRSYTQTTLGSQKALNEMQMLADENARWQVEAHRVAEYRSSFEAFANSAPAWEGLFKELSRLLPSELRVIRLSVSGELDALRLRADANIYTTPTGRDFDEVVEQTLLALDRSPFLSAVQLINSTRYPADGSRLETGAMSVDLELAYPRPLARKGGKE